MLHGVAKCEFIFCLFFLQLKKKKKLPPLVEEDEGEAPLLGPGVGGQ